ncbi:MAG: hypothetical protein AAFO75_00170 [Pseudomonadota bacterium]
MAVALISGVSGTSGHARAMTSLSVWTTLYQHEASVLRDFDLHVTTPAVRKRADDLLNLALSDDVRPDDTGDDGMGSDKMGSKERTGRCQNAARTLSYMVLGYFESSRRLDVSRDWSFYFPTYVEERSACLASLKLEERDYPLPAWIEY